jgi:hypothetical protein
LRSCDSQQLSRVSLLPQNQSVLGKFGPFAERPVLAAALSTAALVVAWPGPSRRIRYNGRVIGGFGMAIDWTLSDKIATIAIVVGFLQFAVLVATVWVMINTGRRQLRAYVHVTEARFTSFAGDSIYLVNYRNTGQTPAYDVASDIAVQLTRFPLAEQLDVKGTGNKGVTTLGRDGDGHVRLEAPRALTPQEYDSVLKGESAVFVYGSVAYSDVFGKRRVTKYRYYVGGDQDIRNDGFMAGHSDGNNAT